MYFCPAKIGQLIPCFEQASFSMTELGMGTRRFDLIDVATEEEAAMDGIRPEENQDDELKGRRVVLDPSS